MITPFIMMLLAVTSGGVASNARSLIVQVTVTEGEHSRDSNSTITSITLTGRRLHYVKNRTGYRSGHVSPVDKTAQARDEDLERIRHLLLEKRLLRSRSSISPTDLPGRYVEIKATLTDHNKRSILAFAAMRQDAERDDLYTGLKALVDELEQIVNP